jgi:hypothetical protein
VWLIQCVEWVLAVFSESGAFQMVFRASFMDARRFTDVWLGSSDRLRMALQEHGTWARELGIRTWPRESIMDICPVWVS